MLILFALDCVYLKPSFFIRGFDPILFRWYFLLLKTSKTPFEKCNEFAVLKWSWEVFIKSAPLPIFIPPGETQNKLPFSDKDIGLFIKLPFDEDTPTITFL